MLAIEFMKRSIIVVFVLVIIAIAVYVMVTRSASSTAPAPAATTNVAPAQSASSSLPAGVTLMQSTGVPFASSADYASSHELYPIEAADAKVALGAFSFTTKDLGGGVTQVTLTNGTEGYQGQSVVVGQGQSVYFIEKSTRDDSPTEDSGTKDDYLVAVDAQGTILQ